MCSAQSRGLALIIVALFCFLLLSKKLHFFMMDKFISWPKLVPAFICFTYLWGKRNVLVPRKSCVKDLLVPIKFLLVPDNQTEVLLHPDEVD